MSKSCVKVNVQCKFQVIRHQKYFRIQLSMAIIRIVKINIIYYNKFFKIILGII